MALLRKAISSIAVACAACGALTIGTFASASTVDTKAATSIALSYSFNESYQEYAAFFTDSTTRTASSEEFTTKVTTFSGPRYSATAAVYAPASSAGAYSYSASISRKGTYSANYIYYSASSVALRLL